MSDAERSVFDILREIAGNVQDIVRTESRLAKARIRASVSAWQSGLLLLGIGALSGIFAVLFALLALVQALSHVLRPWAAALLVSFSLALCAAVVMKAGSKRLKEHSPFRENDQES